MLKKKTIIWILAGAVILSGIIYFSFFRKTKIEYNTVQIQKGKLSQTVSVTGTLKANDTISLNFETSGRIREVRVRVGQVVAMGESLAVLNDENLKYSVDQAKANLDRARAEANVSDDSIHTAEVAEENAEKALEDTKRLNDANLADVEQAKTDAKKKLDDAQEYYDQVKSDDGEESASAKLAKLTLDSAEASYNDARKNLDVADQQADLQETQAQNALNSAKASLDAAKSRYLAAVNNATVAGYEAAYRTALNNLDKAVLRAPAAGIVKEVNFRAGEVYGGSIGGGSNDFAKMISYDFTLEAKVPESDIAKVKTGQSAEVYFDAFAAEEKFGAKVVSIEPSATVVQDVVDYVVKMVIGANDPRFKDGMSADVDILIQEKDNVISIPERSVQDSNGKKIVQILENGKPLDREVKLGLQGDAGVVEVTSGLKEGEVVITSMQ